MYTNHRSLVNTIRKLCQQAQALLEEADILTERDFILRQEIKTHISKITRAELRERLHKPTQFGFKETPIPPPQPQASSSQNLSAHRHCIHYMQSGEPMRCYECNSLSHIKWNCQLYICPLCGQRQPGHYKYKPVTLKTKPVIGELPDEFRIQGEIIGDPLAEMPELQNCWSNHQGLNQQKGILWSKKRK